MVLSENSVVYRYSSSLVIKSRVILARIKVNLNKTDGCVIIMLLVLLFFYYYVSFRSLYRIKWVNNNGNANIVCMYV